MATSWTKYEVLEDLLAQDGETIQTQAGEDIEIVLQTSWSKESDVSTSWTKVADA